MAWTRANLEDRLIRSFGPLLSITEVLDATTNDGTNQSLLIPIHDAILSCGGTVVSSPDVTDDDISTVTIPFVRFFRLLTLYTLELVWNNWPFVDLKSDEDSQMLSQLAKRLQERIKEIKEELTDPDSIENSVIVEGPPTVGKLSAGSCIPGDIFGSSCNFNRWPY